MVGNLKAECNSVDRQRLMETVHRLYPKGWFVGIAEEQIAGAAADFRELECHLRSRGLDPRNVLVVEAGIAVPDYVTIFA